MASDRVLRGHGLTGHGRAREGGMLPPRRLTNSKLEDFDMVKTIGTGKHRNIYQPTAE